MNALRQRCIAAVVTALASAGGAFAQEAPTQPAQNPFKPFDRAKFIENVRTMGADDAMVTAFETQCDEESVGHATEALLRKLVPSYDTAAALAEDGDPKAALELVALIENAETHALVRTHSRYHLGRHFIDNDEPAAAAKVLETLLRRDRNQTALDAEAAFFYGTALAEIPMPGEAAITFGDFLALFPEAPERYRAVAAQRKAELEAQFESPLHGIADKMKSVTRDLRHGRTGKKTQDKQRGVQEDQQEIIDELQKIIEQLEEQEKQSGGAGGSNPSNPASSSSLPGGEARIGSLHDVPKAAERWGGYNDRERKAIEAEVNVRLKGPMKAMVQEYYKKLNQGGGQ